MKESVGPGGYFGVAELLTFLSGGCFAPWAAGPVFCFNAPDGVDSDVVVDGNVVASWGDDGWFDCGGVAALPAGRVTTVPFLGGKYKEPFCPQPTVKVSAEIPAKHNITGFINTGGFIITPAADHAAPPSHE